MTTFGLDYAWAPHPSVSAMKATKDSAGHAVSFVCRYLSNQTSKNLSLAEATTYSNAGIWCVVVWETTASRALSGRAGGVADATKAKAQARACGMPDDRPIYFAVDWDATAAQQATINQYLIGCASVLGVERVGLYAGYGPISRAFAAGVITYGWQTYAWSGGKLFSKAQLHQYSNGHTVGGADVDFNHGIADDFGQWKVGVSLDMPLTSADLEAIRKVVWDSDKAPAPAGSGSGNPTWVYVNLLKDTNERVRAAVSGIAAVAAKTGAPVDTAAVVAGVLAGLAPETLAAAIADHLGPDVATGVLNALRARLEA